ncbi:MOSC domain-containing protein [Fictibacillus barbaricus]|uniref:MOSC domain-containing protein n=1 Tax=Fictibacillus barbaricus TaxID=182136 RepID=A0ABS2ZCW5_9BACL|nr:MOSC N-terminal beta barrel domain-containing protein [Fictibacillus barbaricus]MBN3546038.1 MOSC domain-containing protein [Fictibacillus barbaricus]GGB58121.1 hypothetical protein GCM10007199_25000 [Fictibacillus barbaricus]
MNIGKVKEIRRFPVKSILGETLQSVSIDKRGLIGDRLWAIKNMDGKIGSGKTTRRFQQMDGLFNYKARYEDNTPIITMPDGKDFRSDDNTINEKLSEWLGYKVILAREESISHFDEGPISIITTSALRKVSQDLGEAIDHRRFRANLLVETESTEYFEDNWLDQLILVGSSVTLRVVAPLQRCIMVNIPQEELTHDTRLLRYLVNNHKSTFGVWAKVEGLGDINIGDNIILK